jgi:S-adenosylmethionine-diacylglycerol 3-amino-3-carboxypropyl transferase
MTAAADPCALAAAKLPLAFSQVREDPRLDLEVAARLPPGGNVVMIASGGETAVCLARLPIGRLVLVDVNPAQLALTRCRFHLAETTPPDESMALLGHTHMPAVIRREKWDTIFHNLGLAPNTLGPESMIAELGPDHCGRYEAAFAELRSLLPPEPMGRFLRETDPKAASRMIAIGTEAGDALDSAFASALGLENLVALFGEGATQNPRRPFHEHFTAQLREITARQAPAANPWIWQLLAGKFPPGEPVDWLLDSSPIVAAPEYFQGSMIEALAQTPEQSVDFVHLSNILDWLSPEEACETLAAAYRALRPGGFVLIRQLNSSLDIPSLFPSLKWHTEDGRRLQLSDRSFFYPEILLASRS